MKSFVVLQLGLTHYDRALSFQFEVLERVRESKGKNSFLLLLEHYPVITLGKNASLSNILVSPDILKKRQIEIKQTDRGGDVTFHGPGQLVGYPIMALSYHKKTVKDFIRTIEQTLITALSKFGVKAYTKDGKSAGVWTDEGKIGFIGMRVSRGITYHGFSLNINNDLSLFELINPCGMKTPAITSLSKIICKEIEVSDFIREYLDVFGIAFGGQICKTDKVWSHAASPEG
jgi:lipoate-protein ligase B